MFTLALGDILCDSKITAMQTLWPTLCYNKGSHEVVQHMWKEEENEIFLCITRDTKGKNIHNAGFETARRMQVYTTSSKRKLSNRGT